MSSIETTSSTEPEILWSPPPDVRERTRMGRYLAWLEEHRDLSFDGYEELWAWSVADLDGFWSSVWEFFDIQPATPPEAFLAHRAMPGAVWCPGATLNYAEHLLRGAGQQGPGTVVVRSRSQTRPAVDLTAGQLADQVARARAGLQRLGVDRGDRVVAYLPNIPETLVAFLATASLGAVWASCAPEFGTRSVLDRLQQIEPKVLLTVDGYRYGTRAVDRTKEVAAIRAALGSLRATVAVPYLDPDPRRLPGALGWDVLLSEAPSSGFEPVPFDHPLYVLYSSGTTGLPKPIVHGHGGILIEHVKMLALHHDLGPGDRVFWFSTTGWMVWNFLVSGPAVGATIVLFDGNPGHPDMSALWNLAVEAGVTYFGTSAPFLLACRKAGVRPPRTRIRGLGSTGAPLPAAG